MQDDIKLAAEQYLLNPYYLIIFYPIINFQPVVFFLDKSRILLVEDREYIFPWRRRKDKIISLLDFAKAYTPPHEAVCENTWSFFIGMLSK